jgi:hypothetical protein
MRITKLVQANQQPLLLSIQNQNGDHPFCYGGLRCMGTDGFVCGWVDAVT